MSLSRPIPRTNPFPACLAALVLAALAVATVPAARRVEVLSSIGGLPPHIVGLFREAAGFQQTTAGQYFVFDRRSHAVFGVDEAMTTAWKLVDIGQETGRVLDPTAFDAEPGGTFVVADAPGRVERVQIFEKGGRQLGGFNLPGRAVPRVTLGSLVLSGVGSLQYTGRSVLMSQPETGWLMTEYGLRGTPTRSIGALRQTGYAEDPAVNLALNAGIPLVNPRGGYYFVFHAGVPMFRKYDTAGKLVFERHIEGPEVDPLVQNLPTVWPRHQVGDGNVPLVAPIIRTAAVDAAGHLWVTFLIPYTYVYDPDGEKTRVVQFRGAGILQPTSLFFAGPDRLLITPGCYEFRVTAPR
ncbi:MAG: hypothetical protein Q7V01_15545 [Vicinamibacterales bacterium]|nr:hypothetical protein [Vicinamibacterales bacterium]